MSASTTFDSGLDPRFANAESRERVLLIGIFLFMYVAFGALGRDVFSNRLNDADANSTDPIGLVLPWVRIAACGVGVLIVVSSRGLTWGLSKVPLIFAPYCAFVLASSLWSVDGKSTFRDALALTAMWVGVPMVIHRLGLVRSVQASLHLIAVVLIASTFLAIFFPSIGRHTGLELVQYSHEGRWRGIFNHKNGLGPWAAYGTIFFLSHRHLCTGPRPYWWFAWTCAVLCLVFSGSATAMVAALILIWGWFFFSMLRREHLTLVLVVNAAILVVAGLIVFFMSDAVFALLGRDSSLTGRTELWALYLDHFWEQPWIGYGYLRGGGAEFWEVLETRVGQVITTPDNGYISVLVDTGIIGAVLLLGPILSVFRNGFEWLKYVTLKDRAALEWELMLLAAALVMSVSDSNALICTSFDGVLSFGGFFALMTAPRSPDSRLRGEFRLAKYWAPSKPRTASAPAQQPA